jgi:hypothetical protein
MLQENNQIEIGKEFTDKLTVHKRLDQEVVITTVDKIKLCLIKNRDCLLNKKDWLLPLALLVTFLTSLVAATFNDFLLKPEVWKAIYVLGSIICFIWLVISLLKLRKIIGKGSIDEIVKELKSSANN